MKLKYVGVPVYMNGQNYYIPSLSTSQFRQNYELLSTPLPEGSNALDNFNRFIPVIGLAIRRNYPEVADQDLEEWLDLTTFTLAIKAVQSASGMTPVSEGE